MLMSIIATKLYRPPSRPQVVIRPNLIRRLNEGLRQNPGFERKLTLISAPAGFGKTTLVGEWTAACQQPVAWLSLDAGDNDLPCFLTYLVAALQRAAPRFGEGVLGALQSPQSPPIEAILTILLNEITSISENFVLVLDDYQNLDAKPVEGALIFLLEHLPPQMHLVIATREDPHLPLARLRAGGQLTEVRAADLRFTTAEAAEFLNQVMGLKLAAEDIAALENRTEGWIAGLQLAAISMQGNHDAASFIKSFTGSHRFVLDYLLEEVLHMQSPGVQTFLLRTSILERLCGPLCEAVVLDPPASGQETLGYLEHANLFIVPLDDERRWYRYHHLFADLLRQRLSQSVASSPQNEGMLVAELHRRASQWYEDNGLELEAFQQAAAANDVERAERLIEGKGMPLYFRGVLVPLLNWLETLSTTVLDSLPSLWTTYASVSLATGQAAGVEQKLQAAEAALEAARQSAQPDARTRDIIGRIASIRATLAIYQNQTETIISQSRRALEYLYPDNLAFRTFTTWKLAIAYQIQGDRPAAVRAYTEALTIAQSSGNIITTLVATSGRGGVQEAETQLHLAAAAYRRVLQMAGDLPFPVASFQANLGLARICYEWNDLEAAEQYARQSARLAGHTGKSDAFILCELILARLQLARKDVAGAAAILDKVDQSARQQNFMLRLPEIAEMQMLILIRLGQVAAAAQLARQYELPLSQVRVLIAQGDPSAALGVLEPMRQQMEVRGWTDKRLKTMVLQAVALRAHGEKDNAVEVLCEALALAQTGGFIRLFVDEGPPVAELLSLAAERRIIPDYIGKLLAAFTADAQTVLSGSQARHGKSEDKPDRPIIERLSQHELKILQLIAQGLSNREISERLFLALSTVKGHNRNIFDKLQVQSRTEAVARARESGLL
jgi:LuxR family maltose regulon positive regulatory protein